MDKLTSAELTEAEQLKKLIISQVRAILVPRGCPIKKDHYDVIHHTRGSQYITQAIMYTDHGWRVMVRGASSLGAIASMRHLLSISYIIMPGDVKDKP